MRKFFKLRLLFFKVCWEQGIKKAVMLAMGTIRQRGGIFRLLFPWKETFPPESRSNVSAWIDLLAVKPLVSIIMPVYNSQWLNVAVNSVLNQSYRHFELILVDDCSYEKQTLKAVEMASHDERIHVIRNSENIGISRATNAGIEASHGEYIAFMDHDDLIHPDALALFVRTVNNGHDEDVFFSDEVLIDADASIKDYIQKCPISMDLLLSCNAVSHFCIMKREALLKIGKLKPEYDGAQDYDLMIRAMEHGLRFFHMPYYLYAWRVHRAAVSGDIQAFDRGSAEKPDYPKAYLNGKKALESYLARNNIRAKVTDDAFLWYRVKYDLPDQTDEVAMIVPFKDQVKYLRRFLISLDKTTYQNFVIYLVNNRSELPETLKYLDGLRQKQNPKLRFLDFDEPFNYSRLYNQVVAKIPNNVLLFMNNDMEIINSDWLEAMLEHIYRDNVGAVGCRLIRKNGSIQHAGLTYQPNIYYCTENLSSEHGYYTRVQRDVSGVTAACMMIWKSVFQEVGGFDEIQFPIGFSDADMCLKIIRAGYKIIYTPFAELRHYESVSRKVYEESYEKFTLFNRYIGDTQLQDKHYKPS